MDIIRKLRLHQRFHEAHDEEYWIKYLSLVQKVDSYRLAYELTEEWYLEQYGVCRYSSYESFRVAKHRRYRT